VTLSVPCASFGRRALAQNDSGTFLRGIGKLEILPKAGVTLQPVGRFKPDLCRKLQPRSPSPEPLTLFADWFREQQRSFG